VDLSDTSLTGGVVDSHSLQYASSPNMEIGNWQPVPRDQDVLFKGVKSNVKVKPYTPSDIPPPSTPLTKVVEEFARSHVDPKAFNHSNRIYYFGLAIIKATFPEYVVDEETWFCTCLLHDIGLADKFHLTTKMSFEVCHNSSFR
jgi:cyanamide hydratase